MKVKLYFLAPDDSRDRLSERLASSMSPRGSSNDSDDMANMITFDRNDPELSGVEDSSVEDDDSLSDTDDDDDAAWSQA